MAKNIKCDTHPICTASDSAKPLCKCWCPECKEYMAEIRKNYKMQVILPKGA